MGLGRTTRFAKLPKGARRVSVMLKGAGGIKALAPSPELFDDFRRAKASMSHEEAFRAVRYRERFLAQVRGSAEAMTALRELVAESKTRDVYLM
jgi:hypothetical protein